MKKRLIIACALLLLLSTYKPKKLFLIDKFNVEEIKIENNFILKEKNIKKNLISLYDGITISELLKKLKITKQSLNRVLKDLIKIKVVDFKKDKKDTRLKHVYLNDKGTKLFNEVFDIQKKRIYNALLASSSKEVINFNNVLNKIINEKI